MCDGNVPAWLVAVALGLFLAARLVIGSQRQSPRQGQVPVLDAREHAVEILKDRYVRGEIDHHEFLSRLDGLFVR
ncbi:hypothetical protein ABZZ74_45095 [Streptomyces sp. NPDC006476]|uniref:hypothetical protein n=1 Tax=Streptomyces sp. NPDC006476 TaxID=3157175 RepID=UPI0033A5A1E9